jgi:hypothetical protein
MKPTAQGDATNDRVPQALHRVRPWHVILVLCLIPVLLIAKELVFPKRERPQVTSEAIAEARARWREHGPKSYDISIRFHSFNTGDDTFDLEVRDGHVSRAVKNGSIEIVDKKEYWTVDSQLDEIAADIERRDQGGYNVKQNVTIELYAEFDAELGYVRRYEHIIVRNPQNYDWEVTSFRPVE